MRAALRPALHPAAAARNMVDGIEGLNLSVRPYNCLKHEGIRRVSQLVTYSERGLRGIPSLGSKSLNEIKAKLAQQGLSLKDEPQYPRAS